MLCDAYHKWRLLRAAPPVEPFQKPARGMIVSEGAGALLLCSEGRASARPISIEKIASGTNFRKQREAAACVDKVFAELCTPPPDFVAASANGTFIDEAEHAAILAHCPKAKIYPVKAPLGESVGASSLWQTICAAQSLFSGQVPPIDNPAPAGDEAPGSAVVSTCGLNQQVAGLRLSLSPPA